MEQDGAQTEPQATGRASTLGQMATRHRKVAAQERAAFDSALRVAFGRMASDCPGLDGAVQDVQVREVSLPEVIDEVEPGMFLSLLEGRGERLGLIMACPQVLAGMIEAQTTGCVDSTDPPRRKPTRTDAALLAPMIDAFLRLIEARCAALPQARQVSGFAYGSFLDDPRPLGLMLDDGRYCLLRLQVSLGFGARQGVWIVVLPMPDPAPAHREAPEAETRDWSARLEATVSGAPVQLQAVLCRVQIALTEALRLRPGDVLRLPETALEALALETISEQPLGIGRLGQARGQRAVRLTATPGTLTDAMGVSVSPVALPATILPLRPPQTAFVPPAGSDGAAQPADPDAAPTGPEGDATPA